MTVPDGGSGKEAPGKDLNQRGVITRVTGWHCKSPLGGASWKDGGLGSVRGGGHAGEDFNVQIPLLSTQCALSLALYPLRSLLQWLQYVYGSCLDLGSLHKQKHEALTGVIRSRCQSCESLLLLWHHGQGSQVLVS